MLPTLKEVPLMQWVFSAMLSVHSSGYIKAEHHECLYGFLYGFYQVAVAMIVWIFAGVTV